LPKVVCLTTFILFYTYFINTNASSSIAITYKGYVKKVFPPLHVFACAVSQLPRHLLGRILSL
jgi:type IV secretory pathway VirB6-like protein